MKMPSCAKISKPDGTFYTKDFGTTFRLGPGEKIVGRSYNCGHLVKPVTPNLQQELSAELGVGFGDILKQLAKPFAKVMGKQGCSSCEARRLITNAYAKLKAKHGQLEAMTTIRDLWALSFKASGDEVLKQLEAKLHD